MEQIAHVHVLHSEFFNSFSIFRSSLRSLQCSVFCKKLRSPPLGNASVRQRACIEYEVESGQHQVRHQQRR